MIGVDKVASSLFVALGKQQMHVRLYGAGSPVLLLHGGGPGTTGEGWRDFMNASTTDCQFIAPDFLGFGLSDTPIGVYSQKKILHSVLALIRIMNLRHICLVGHSMGAALAVELAISFPDLVDRLVLIAPGGGLYGLTYHSPGIEQIHRCALAPSRVNIADLVALMSYKEKSWQAQIDARMKVIELPGVLATQHGLLRSRLSRDQVDSDLADRLIAIKKMSMPVALFWGEFERFNPFEIGQKISSLLPDTSHFEIVRDAGHNVHYDEPEISAKLFDTFLTKSIALTYAD
jgi:pimeloyl-ACP methyl ester carboxylesterase